jgi:Mrp family chromosome partitioning ATPase
MTSIILVAGNGTEPLKKFLQNRGSVEVLHSFDNLADNQEKLFNGIYRADKLLYLNQDKSINIRKDMQVLRDLLLGEGFFTVNEILFFSLKDGVGSRDADFFEAVMMEVNNRSSERSSIVVPDYTIHEFEKALSYDSIYSSLLGITEALKVTNKFESVYVVERNSEAKNSYEKEDSSNIVIEPFNYSNLNRYESMKGSILLTESKEIIIESKESNVEKLGVSFDELEIPSLDHPMIVLVSGNRKSGVSMYTSAISVSASYLGKRVLILDLSSNKGAHKQLEGSVPFAEITLKSVLTSSVIEIKEGISILHDFPEKLNSYILRNIVANIDKFKCDLIVVDIHDQSFEKSYKLTEKLNPKVFLVSRPKLIDLLEVRKIFTLVKSADLILNKHSSLEKEDVPVEDIKIMMKNLNRLVRPIEFENLAIKGNLSKRLLGV